MISQDLNSMKILILPFLFCTVLFTSAQVDSKNNSLEIKGYLDSYLSADNEKSNSQYRSFSTTAPRSNHVGLNVVQLGATYHSKNIRSSVMFHYGDIAGATWSDEFNAIQEANVGIQIHEKLWIDTGLFTTHIGTESFLPKNNWTTTTTVATFNEPFYQAGIKMSYEFSSKWSGELWLLNGYNQFINDNDKFSLGVLLNYNLNDYATLTYKNLLGDESFPESSIKQFRTYHNLYITTAISTKLLLQVGGDYGTQTNSGINNSKTLNMYNFLSSLKLILNDKFSITSRFELFKDKSGFISGLVPSDMIADSGLQLYGLTASIEYRPSADSFIRLEARRLETTNDALIFDSQSQMSRTEVMFNIGFVIDRKLKW